MAAPNVTISVEPRESGKAVFLPLAAKTSNAQAQGQLSLRLDLKNNEASTVTLTSVKVSFPGSSVAASTIPVSLAIEAGKTAAWFFAPANNILLPMPAPASLQVDVSCSGFSSPATVTLGLAPHTSPTLAGSYRFPAHSTDLRDGEFWRGVSAKHGAAGGGTQLFAYDMGVMAWNGQGWTEILPGTTGTQNADYRIYGKPIYAMADGTVVAFLNTMAENTKMGKQDPTPNPVEGNHFYIQHGDELMVYAHFQTGSLNPKLMQVGAAVKAGDFLGLAGNSGNSTNPHLHIHCLQATKPWGGPPRPLPFHDIHVIDQTAVSMPNRTGPWVKVSKQGLPSTQAAIWPYRRAPVSQVTDALTPHAVGIAASGTYANRYLQGLTRQAFLDETQKLFDEQGLRLTQLKTYLDHGQRRWAGICRSGDWANRLIMGLPWSDFVAESQRLFDNHGLRLVNLETWVENGQQLWAGICRSGDWGSRLVSGKQLSDFLAATQKLFDDEDLRLINVVTYGEGAQRRWAGICRSGDWANRFVADLTWSDFLKETQKLFDERGLRLVDVLTYKDALGIRRWAGIARGGSWANRLFASNNLADFADDGQRYFDEKGLRLVGVEIYTP